MSQGDNHAVWEQKLLELEHVQDGIGKGLDQNIIETVAVLQLLDVHTRASCEGHMHHGVAAPWVDIESSDPRLAECRGIYSELAATADACEDAGQVADAVYAEMHVIREEIDRIAAVEYKKLIPYLEEFYHGRSAAYTHRIMIDYRGRLSCQGALLQPAEEVKTRALRLKEYQQEMRAFSEFLKQKFFS